MNYELSLAYLNPSLSMEWHPTLNNDLATTHPELASLNKIYRIWDAGKTKWVKTILMVE